ncbi:MAG: hypothetical protein Fur0039_04750 [Rhodocyclaceae bacterium]
MSGAVPDRTAGDISPIGRVRPGAITGRGFALLAVLALVFRLWLAWVLPFTGDEAYFFYWGKWPDWGFYDHPPMVGWWLAALQRISPAEWFLRLPSVVLPLVLAGATAAYLRRISAQLAWTTAAIVLLAPANVWNVAITTDTPLVFFGFLSGLAFLRAAEDDDPRFYLLAGVLLGGAFLSKYFAVFLAAAYGAYCLSRPGRGQLRGLVLVALGAAPAVALNLWWNAQHCWANVMFNLYNRHGGAGFSWGRPPLYALELLYLLSPPALWFLARRGGILALRSPEAELRALAWLAVLPLALFALLSLVKTIGLHWLLSFIPFAFLLLARVADADALRVTARFCAAFAALHIAAIAAIAALPVETWRATRWYDGIVMTVKADELLARLAPYEKDYVFATDGYSPSATLGYDAKRYFIVFGEGSSHARHDDILTDFRALEGRNILVLRKSPPDPRLYERYFERVEYRNFDLHGASFHLVLGHGFRYAPYRDGVLAKMRDAYYAIPAWLPAGRCYFCERYFAGEACARRSAAQTR